ncbi:hypothetical protein, partial [Vibrio anguillarum]|uniref:hypothetical protein n=1 Tax=Vibrio anguillarum TaxID=55601 RepID=UPI001BE0D018
MSDIRLYLHHYNAAFPFSNLLYQHRYRLSSQTAFPKERYWLTVFRMSRNIRLDAHYKCEEPVDHERALSNLFPTP